MREVIAIFENLNMGANEETRENYWAARILHLSHLNLLVQVWLLARKPKKLGGDYSGWQNFAEFVAKELSGIDSSKKPEWYNAAVKDIWDSLGSYQIPPSNFVSWLKKLALIKHKRTYRLRYVLTNIAIFTRRKKE
jgi:hypothetical protein